MDCKRCGSEGVFVEEYGEWYCRNCNEYYKGKPPAGHVPPQAAHEAPRKTMQDEPGQRGPPRSRHGRIYQLWDRDYYMITQKRLSLGRKFYFWDENKNKIGFCQGTHLKWKDEFRVYEDDSKTLEILFIKQEQVFDAWGTFGVHDSLSGETVGYFSRKFWRSMFRDQWMLHDANQKEIGILMEDSLMKAILRRFIKILPKRMHISVGGNPVIHFKRKFLTFGTWWIDCNDDPNRHIDRRMIVAGTVLMEAVEQIHK